MRFNTKLVASVIILILFQAFLLNVKAQMSSNEADEIKRAKSLIGAINKYRREKGLDEIPYSPWLTVVARNHAYDLEVNNPNKGSCSTHSWSNKGVWSSCCYDLSSPNGECMWNKPKELSKGAYKSNGFEIAVGPSARHFINIQESLEAWQGSKPHLDVILNRDKWAGFKWKAIGAGISNYYAVVWFAEDADTFKEAVVSNTPRTDVSNIPQTNSCAVESTLRSRESTSPVEFMFTLISQSKTPIILYW